MSVTSGAWVAPVRRPSSPVFVQTSLKPQPQPSPTTTTAINRERQSLHKQTHARVWTLPLTLDFVAVFILITSCPPSAYPPWIKLVPLPHPPLPPRGCKQSYRTTTRLHCQQKLGNESELVATKRAQCQQTARPPGTTESLSRVAARGLSAMLSRHSPLLHGTRRVARSSAAFLVFPVERKMGGHLKFSSLLAWWNAWLIRIGVNLMRCEESEWWRPPNRGTLFLQHLHWVVIVWHSSVGVSK